jgi:hypothetical protein
MAGILSLKTPSNGLVTLTPTDTATNKDITIPATSGSLVVQDGTNTTTVTNLAYTGTLTGGTGVVNIGSGQVYKDASGNVGIGTASPAARLNVIGGSITIDSAFQGDYGLCFRNGFETTENCRISTGDTGFARKGGLRLAAYDGIAFGTGSNSWNERMRLDFDGSLLIGRTNKLNQEKFGYTTTTDIGAIAQRNAATFYPLVFETSSGTAGYIFSNVLTTSYVTSSDYRLKENVVPMTGALQTVAALKPCTYTWKADGSQGQGFIAHELQAVVPDCVTGTKDAVDAEGNPQYQGVDTSFLVATLVSAIQELTARLEALENK